MSIDPLLQARIDVSLRAIDQRVTSTRDQLQVNQPDHAPTPRVIVPSHYHPAEPS